MIILINSLILVKGKSCKAVRPCLWGFAGAESWIFYFLGNQCGPPLHAWVKYGDYYYHQSTETVSWSKCFDVCASLNATFLTTERNRSVVRLYFILPFWIGTNSRYQSKEGLSCRSKTKEKDRFLFNFLWIFPGVVHFSTPLFFITPHAVSLQKPCTCAPSACIVLSALTMANNFTSFSYLFTYKYIHLLQVLSPLLNQN